MQENTVAEILNTIAWDAQSRSKVDTFLRLVITDQVRSCRETVTARAGNGFAKLGLAFYSSEVRKDGVPIVIIQVKQHKAHIQVAEQLADMLRIAGKRNARVEIIPEGSAVR